MTTDTVPKMATVDAGGARFGGIAKGAGMLAPQLATMLVFLTTDAIVDPEEFRIPWPRHVTSPSVGLTPMPACRPMTQLSLWPRGLPVSA